MKYSINSYAVSLAKAIQSSVDYSQTEKNFLDLLKKNRDEHLGKKIIDQTEKILRKEDNSKNIVVTFARSQDKNSKELLKDLLKENDSFEIKLKPELLAGMTIEINNELYFDGSLKGKLDKLFN